MLTDEERERIKAEEQYRAELRAAERSTRRRRYFRISLRVLLTLLLGFVFLWFLVDSGPDATKHQLVGATMSVEGRVTDKGRRSVSGNSYVVVEGQGKSVICYTAQQPAIDSRVVAAGKVTAWSETGGTFQPCVLASR